MESSLISGDIMKRILAAKGVVGTIIMNADGIPISSTVDNTTTLQYSGLTNLLAERATGVVRDLDPSDTLKYFRIRTKKHEILVAPDKDFLIIVIQNPISG